MQDLVVKSGICPNFIRIIFVSVSDTVYWRRALPWAHHHHSSFLDLPPVNRMEFVLRVYNIDCTDIKYMFPTGVSTNKLNTIHDKYETPTCFGTGVSSAGSLLEQRNISPTHYFRYCIDLTRVIKILKL
jgi:hypothetical protein